MPFYYGAIIPSNVALVKIAEAAEKDKTKPALPAWISRLYHVELTAELETKPLEFWQEKCKSILPYREIFLLPVQSGKYLLCGRIFKLPSDMLCSAVSLVDTPPPKDLHTAVLNFLHQHGLKSYEPQIWMATSLDDLYLTTLRS
jgi:hypothetical protein